MSKRRPIKTSSFSSSSSSDSEDEDQPKQTIHHRRKTLEPKKNTHEYREHKGSRKVVERKVPKIRPLKNTKKKNIVIVSSSSESDTENKRGKENYESHIREFIVNRDPVGLHDYLSLNVSIDIELLDDLLREAMVMQDRLVIDAVLSVPELRDRILTYYANLDDAVMFSYIINSGTMMGKHLNRKLLTEISKGTRIKEYLSQKFFTKGYIDSHGEEKRESKGKEESEGIEEALVLCIQRNDTNTIQELLQLGEVSTFRPFLFNIYALGVSNNDTKFLDFLQSRYRQYLSQEDISELMMLIEQVENYKLMEYFVD